MGIKTRPESPGIGAEQSRIEGMLRETLSRRLRSEREAQKLTLEGLAGIAAVHWTTIGKIERGQQTPSIALLAILTNALGISISDVLDDALGCERDPSEDATIELVRGLPVRDRERLLPVLSALVEWNTGS